MMMAAIRITLEKYLLRVVMDFLPIRLGAFFSRQICCTRKQERVSTNIFKNTVLFNMSCVFKTEKAFYASGPW